MVCILSWPELICNQKPTGGFPPICGSHLPCFVQFVPQRPDYSPKYSLENAFWRNTVWKIHSQFMVLIWLVWYKMSCRILNHLHCGCTHTHVFVICVFCVFYICICILFVFPGLTQFVVLICEVLCNLSPTVLITHQNTVWRNTVWRHTIWINKVWRNTVWKMQFGKYTSNLWLLHILYKLSSADLITHQNTDWGYTVWRNTFWRNTVWINTVWRNTVWRNTVWRNTVWRNTVWKIHFQFVVLICQVLHNVSPGIPQLLISANHL